MAQDIFANDDLSFLQGNADPNGSVISKTGSIYVNLTTGEHYKNTSVTNGSVWTLEGSGGAPINSWSAGTGVDSIILSDGGIASGDFSTSEGKNTTASGKYSHAEGQDTTAIGFRSHSEGQNTIATGHGSHAEGFGSKANSSPAHAEGKGTTAGGTASHSEGMFTKALGTTSHSEGISTTASGSVSHSEGSSTTASGFASHAGGSNSIATGASSFVHSDNSTVSGDRSVVLGGLNINGANDDTVYVPNLNIKDLLKTSIFTVVTLPVVTANLNGSVTMVSDGDALGHTIPVYCDGLNWRNFHNNLIVSSS